MIAIHKYPRTRHIEGSRLQPGDQDLSQVSLAELAGVPLVVEEKVDGANCAVSFTEDGKLLLQSRGHYLTGGARERHFDLFKQWAGAHQHALHQVLGARYVMYGEWVYAKHTIFYDALPHYFLEFDVLDRERGCFLSTPARRGLLDVLPVASVPVIGEQMFRDAAELADLVTGSAYKSAVWRESLERQCESLGLDTARTLAETDASPLMEGLYLKREEAGVVKDRFKWIRASFLTAVVESESHWLARPILPNLLRDGVDLFSR